MRNKNRKKDIRLQISLLHQKLVLIKPVVSPVVGTKNGLLFVKFFSTRGPGRIKLRILQQVEFDAVEAFLKTLHLITTEVHEKCLKFRKKLFLILLDKDQKQNYKKSLRHF